MHLWSSGLGKSPLNFFTWVRVLPGVQDKENVMKILVNDITEITVDSPDLRVKDGKLYNTKTQLFEGVQGDAIWFLVDKGGYYVSKRGLVAGYTDFKTVKLIGNDEVFTAYSEFKRIEHVSTVRQIDDEDELLAATMAL